jgi:voltage-gated potassium channel
MARPRRRQPQDGGLLASPQRNLVLGVSFTVAVMGSATLAYTLAGWSLGDAFYMVVMTVYTVGYGEVHAVDTPLLRTITIATIILGCTGMIFVTGALVQLITASQINQIFGLKRMNARIDHLKDHVIICGFGRLGAVLAKDLQAGGAPFVVLELSDKNVGNAATSAISACRAMPPMRMRCARSASTAPAPSPPFCRTTP